jgi:hypothetical protein
MEEMGLTKPWTGRICNDSIDVVHFSFSVIIDSKEVLGFMQELCSEKKHLFKGYYGKKQTRELKHNQITILKSDVTPVDRLKDSLEGYYYGDDSIVRLDLVCEYIFGRSGYDVIKPGSIKEMLGQSDAAEEGDDKKGSKRRKSRRKSSRARSRGG